MRTFSCNHSLATTATTRAPPHLFMHRLPSTLWRMPLAASPVSEDYVMPWPSSPAPRRGGVPGVHDAYALEAQPDSSPTMPRGAVAASYDYPVNLISCQPAPVIVKRRSSVVSAALGADDGVAWPVSPGAAEAAVADDYMMEWPSSLAVRAARPRVADDYVMQWPSSAAACSKPAPTDVVTWRARAA
ncbi:hypothetical protein T492DRAFT_1044526 [Pavlovales sp. CCMP2436]|nr:hypothetical protein T492DRAFT_1044526 [Pavlovales sp. CCMP2436]